MRVRVLLTPGHTHTHLSFALEADGESVAVFTGGSLLFGSTGRPDLLGPDHTQTLAHAQWHSAQRLAAELPDETAVYPTHGFGSFCSATQSGGTASTIGQEKLANPALTTDEARYVEELLAGLDAYPAYYAHMGPANSAGPGEPDLSLPTEADPAELRRRIEAGEWVVDLRNRTAFAAGHVGGTVNFGLDGQFVTYLAWLMPWGTPVTLLGETAEDVAEAQRELVRVGIDRPAAMATGTPEDWAGGEPLRSYRTRDASPTSPPSCRQPADRRARRAAQPGARRAATSTARSTSRSTRCSAASTRSRPAPSGCTAPAATAPASSPPCSTPTGVDVVAIDDSFDNAGPAGLPLTDRDPAGDPRMTRTTRPSTPPPSPSASATLRSPDPTLIDVRTPVEFEAGHIPGAVNVPLDELKGSLDELRAVLRRPRRRPGLPVRRARRAGPGGPAPGRPRPTAGSSPAASSTGRPPAATVNAAARRWELERQVRLAAGSLVVTGIAGQHARARGRSGSSGLRRRRPGLRRRHQHLRHGHGPGADAVEQARGPRHRLGPGPADPEAVTRC